LKSRTYLEIFPAKKTRIIFFEIMLAPLGQTIDTEVIFAFYDEQGNSLSSEIRKPITLQHDMDRCWSGWGYTAKNNWLPGKYTVKIRIGNSEPTTGVFTVI